MLCDRKHLAEEQQSVAKGKRSRRRRRRRWRRWRRRRRQEVLLWTMRPGVTWLLLLRLLKRVEAPQLGWSVIGRRLLGHAILTASLITASRRPPPSTPPPLVTLPLVTRVKRFHSVSNEHLRVYTHNARQIDGNTGASRRHRRRRHRLRRPRSVQKQQLPNLINYHQTVVFFIDNKQHQHINLCAWLSFPVYMFPFSVLFSGQMKGRV